MGKKFILSLVLISLLSGLSSALEIKNVKMTYGPLGAPRTVNSFLPGDLIFMTFNVDGLSFDQKTGKANYETKLELRKSGDDANGVKQESKVVFEKTTPAEVSVLLGGTELPGDLHLIMGDDQPPGRYDLRLIVTDKTNNKQTHFEHSFELLKKGFGLVGITAPAIAFYGQDYACGFALVNMKLDSRGKPSADITMRVLDRKGTPLMKPIITSLPADMPAEVDLTKENFLPMQFPIFLNRSGRFIMEIEAVDKLGKQQSKLRYNLTVVRPKIAG